MGLSQDDVIQILKILEDSNFNELQLEMGDLKIIVKKSSADGCGPEVSAADPSGAAILSTASSPSSEPQKETAGAIDEEAQGMTPIKSPMLGTFYKASKPGAPPFVQEGQFIKEDDTVCIIEVMKLFNTVKAGMRGRVTRILAEDAKLVEFNQTLFLVDESADEMTGLETKAS